MSEELKLAAEVGKMLKQKKFTIAAAESCTGGLFTSLLTDIAGSSAYVKGSVISYTNAVKHDIVGVKAETLEKFGAVSEETAAEMSTGIRNLLSTDIGVGITGLAGPDGDEGKAPGLVYISISDNKVNITNEFHFKGDRLAVKKAAAMAALKLVLEISLEE